MKKIESGRSMIEMLGVLAIIGVLSIGGLAAYSAAMDRHQANELLNDASTCLILAKSDNLTGDCYGESAILGKTTPVTGCSAEYADEVVTITCTDTDIATAITDKNGDNTVE